MQLQPIASTPADVMSTDITDAQAWTLLGGVSARIFARWEEGKTGRIARDLKMWMAHLMGIHKGLRYLFKEHSRLPLE